MVTFPCKLYRDFPRDGYSLISRTLVTVLDRSEASRPVPVLFRADDIGVLSANYLRLLGLFASHQISLCLAVVPAWLTKARWAAMKTHIDTSSPQWCWHQHGWRHANHQRSGKKGEFGSAREKQALKDDLVRGRDRLQAIMATNFSPFFTPPWNRCSQETLALLADLGFKGVSRSMGEQGQTIPVEDFFVNVDLHTRKEPDGPAALAALADELRQAVEHHYVSVMIHHQLMNEAAFQLLEVLLAQVAADPRFRAATFTELSGSDLPERGSVRA